MASKRTTKKPPKSAGARSTGDRVSVDEVIRALENEGSAKTMATCAHHGAKEPMLGVLFGTLKLLVDRIGVEHELARALRSTTNLDARNRAMKFADPTKISSADTDPMEAGVLVRFHEPTARAR